MVSSQAPHFTHMPNNQCIVALPESNCPRQISSCNCSEECQSFSTEQPLHAPKALGMVKESKHWAHTRQTPPGSTNAGCLTQSPQGTVSVTLPTPTATWEPRKRFEDEKCYLFAKYPLSAEKQHHFLHPNDSYTKFFSSQRSSILSKVGKK